MAHALVFLHKLVQAHLMSFASRRHRIPFGMHAVFEEVEGGLVESDQVDVGLERGQFVDDFVLFHPLLLLQLLQPLVQPLD